MNKNESEEKGSMEMTISKLTSAENAHLLRKQREFAIICAYTLNNECWIKKVTRLPDE